MKIRIHFDTLNEMLHTIKDVYYSLKESQKRNDISSWMEEVKFEEEKNDKELTKYINSNASSSKSS